MLKKYGYLWDSGFWKLMFPIPKNFGQRALSNLILLKVSLLTEGGLD